MTTNPYKRWVAWRRKRQLRREGRYLVREIQRIYRVYCPEPERCLTGVLGPTGWGRVRHGLKVGFTAGLWYLYRAVARRRGPELTRETAAELADSVAVFHNALERGRLGRAQKALETLDRQITDHLGFARKSTVREYAESIGIAVFIALLLRAFVVEAFKIPSGSMIPTLEVGDHIFVNKFSYGLRIPFTKKPPRRFVTWSKPGRGDVVVFINRKNVKHDFIKRVVAVAGDEVKVSGGTVYLRRGGKGPWKAVRRQRVNRPCGYQDLENDRWTLRSECEYFTEELDGARYLTVVDKDRENKDFPPLDRYREAAVPLGSIRVDALQLYNPYRVPEGKVFVMGDNRTNSQDSRYPKELGFVEDIYIKGKALVVWSSWGPGSSWWGLRWNRIGHVIH